MDEGRDARALRGPAKDEDQKAGLATLIALANGSVESNASVESPPSLPASLDTPADDESAARTRELPVARVRRWTRLVRAAWPLPLMLAVQAWLSLPSLRVNTAFQDEALYIWAGRMEWSHWLHGTSLPLYPTYFSGAPVIYPPLAAVAYGLGGLAGARLLSLLFMLFATAFLWRSASILFGPRAGVFAAATWAVLGPTLHLGAFATYDAMSLSLVAAAVWCALHIGPRRDETGWLLAAATAMVLANATKYASTLFDPVIIAMIVIKAWPSKPGRKAALAHGSALLSYASAALIMLVTIGGGAYDAGIAQTTLARNPGTYPASEIFKDSWTWTGTVIGMAVVGLSIAFMVERRWHQRLMLVVLAVAVFLVPLEQARIHTLTSLDKHVDFGAWFGAIALGYAVDRVVMWLRPRFLRVAATAVCGLLLVLPAKVGVSQSHAMARAWPNSSQFDQVFGKLTAGHLGPLLVETPSVPEFYLPIGVDWKLWSSTTTIVLPSGHSVRLPDSRVGKEQVFSSYVKRGYFKWIALNFFSVKPIDMAIESAIKQNGAYRLVAQVPYGGHKYLIWELDRTSRRRV